MKNSVRAVLGSVVGVVLVFGLIGCDQPKPRSSSVAVELAPPGPADLGPATGLSEPSAEAIVFDLKYQPQRGGADDIEYHSFWGYGGSSDEAKKNPFLQDVRRKFGGVREVNASCFKGREWAAVACQGPTAHAFYFDLNANGKLDENEKIKPSRSSDNGVDFITPDFMNPLDGGGETLCRVLLQVNFYGSPEPNFMWSPAAMMAGTATLGGDPVRLLLYSSAPGEVFNQFGSSAFSLLTADPKQGQYIPRERLSSLIAHEGEFYHLSVQGERSNGLPARAVLVKDDSPVGTLQTRLLGTNQLQSGFSSLSIHGVDDKTVFFSINSSKAPLKLPVGSYALERGTLSYGEAKQDEWQVSFSRGPRAAIRDGEQTKVAFGQPTLKIRAINERTRYQRDAVEATSFKKGTQIYLEPTITGMGQEVFTRFRQPRLGNKADRPPNVTITDASGKQLLSKTMEYG